MATCGYLWLLLASWVVGFYSVYHPYNIQWLRVKTLILPSLNYHHGKSLMELEPKSAMVNVSIWRS